MQDGALAIWRLRTPFPGKALASGKGLGTSSQSQRPLKPFPVWIIDYPFRYGTIWPKDSSNLKLFLLDLSKEETLSKGKVKNSIKIMKNLCMHIYNFNLLITHFSEMHKANGYRAKYTIADKIYTRCSLNIIWTQIRGNSVSCFLDGPTTPMGAHREKEWVIREA